MKSNFSYIIIVINRNVKEIAKLRGSEDLWEVAKLHGRESSFPAVLLTKLFWFITDFLVSIIYSMPTFSKTGSIGHQILAIH